MSTSADRSATSRGASPAPAKGALGRFLSLELLDNRYPALHGLRVLAIIGVVQVHVTTVFTIEQGIAMDRDFVTGSLTIFFGMDLFFILSGFLIGSILLRSIKSDGKQRIGRFYARRVSRTFPSYYVVLTFIALTTAMTAMQKKHLWLEYVYATNFMSLFRPDILMFWAWSLALEEQFYLTVPLLFFGLRHLRTDRARVIALTILWAAALVTRLVIYFRHGQWSDIALYDALYFRPHTRFDTLVAGVLLALVHDRWRVEITKWLEVPKNRAILALPSLACLWLLLRPAMFGPENVQLVHVFTWGSVTSVMYFLWLILLLHTDGWVQRALSAAFFRRIATLGYGVYLVHIPIIDNAILPAARALEKRHVSMAIVWPASLVVVMLSSLVIGYVMHVLIEKPSLALRDRVAG